MHHIHYFQKRLIVILILLFFSMQELQPPQKSAILVKNASLLGPILSVPLCLQEEKKDKEAKKEEKEKKKEEKEGKKLKTKDKKKIKLTHIDITAVAPPGFFPHLLFFSLNAFLFLHGLICTIRDDNEASPVQKIEITMRLQLYN